MVTANRSVHLANCGSDTGNFIRSVIAYYPDDSQSNSGQPPQAVVNTSPGGGQLVTWEGNAISGLFGSSGVTFTSHIQSGAGSFPVGQFAGTGNNGRNFACFKDNNRQLWRTSQANACFSVYYCLDVRSINYRLA